MKHLSYCKDCGNCFQEDSRFLEYSSGEVSFNFCRACVLFFEYSFFQDFFHKKKMESVYELESYFPRKLTTTIYLTTKDLVSLRFWDLDYLDEKIIGLVLSPKCPFYLEKILENESLIGKTPDQENGRKN